MERGAGPHSEPDRGPPSRHRDGLPALLAVRDGLGRREHRRRGGRALRPSRDLGARARALRALRNAARPRPAAPPPVRRRAATGRDRALPPPAPDPPRPRRADLGADPPGGAEPVRYPAGHRARRVQPALYQPQARGDPRSLRHRDDPPRGGRRRRRRPEDHIAGGARRADGGLGASRDPPRAGHGPIRPPVSRYGASTPRPRTRSAPTSRMSRSRSTGARSSASRGFPATGRPSLRPC